MQSYHTLGIMLKRDSQLEAAIIAYQQAADIRKQLVADYPETPLFVIDLGGSLINLGNSHLALEKRERAIEYYQSAVDQLTKVYTTSPDLAKGIELLILASTELGGTKRLLGKIEQAAETFVELAERFPRDADLQYEIACELALCAVTAGEEEEEIEVSNRISEQAIACLELAIKLGWKDFDRLEEDSRLESLRSKATFNKVRSQVGDQRSAR